MFRVRDNLAVNLAAAVVAFASGDYVSAYVRGSSGDSVLDSKIPLPEGPVFITQVGMSGTVAAVAAGDIDEGRLPSIAGRLGRF